MRILLAVDDSEHSNAAIESVSARPWPEGSAVRVLCVAESYTPLPIPEASLDNEAVPRSILERTQGVVDRALARLAGVGVAVDSRVREGDPRREIVDEAKGWGADLVVLGSHGRTGMERWLLGSVAENVVRHASCSVEVVRQLKG